MTTAHPWPAGWTLIAEDDNDGDCVKRDYWLVSPEGRRHLLDVSPYRRTIPTHIVSMMVDMGVPERGAFGIFSPLTDDLIEARWIEWAAQKVAAE